MNGELATARERLKTLETSSGKRAGHVADPSWWPLKASPTCPPSRGVYMHGGTAWCDSTAGSTSYEGRCYTVPSRLCDFDDPASMTTAVTFANAGCYRSYLLILLFPYGAPVRPTADKWNFALNGGRNETATAAEAEAELLSAMAAGYAWPAFNSAIRGVPLCGLILRNDADAGPGTILPIDLVNRGRSYMWPTDMRPKWFYNH